MMKFAKTFRIKSYSFIFNINEKKGKVFSESAGRNIFFGLLRHDTSQDCQLSIWTSILVYVKKKKAIKWQI